MGFCCKIIVYDIIRILTATNPTSLSPLAVLKLCTWVSSLISCVPLPHLSLSIIGWAAVRGGRCNDRQATRHSCREPDFDQTHLDAMERCVCGCACMHDAYMCMLVLVVKVSSSLFNPSLPSISPPSIAILTLCTWVLSPIFFSHFPPSLRLSSSVWWLMKWQTSYTTQNRNTSVLTVHVSRMSDARIFHHSTGCLMQEHSTTPLHVWYIQEHTNTPLHVSCRNISRLHYMSVTGTLYQSTACLMQEHSTTPLHVWYRNIATLHCMSHMEHLKAPLHVCYWNIPPIHCMSHAGTFHHSTACLIQEHTNTPLHVSCRNISRLHYMSVTGTFHQSTTCLMQKHSTTPLHVWYRTYQHSTALSHVGTFEGSTTCLLLEHSTNPLHVSRRNIPPLHCMSDIGTYQHSTACLI